MEKLLHYFFYRALFVLLLLGVCAFIYQIVFPDGLLWGVYKDSLFVTALIFLWVEFWLLFRGDTSSKKYREYKNEPILVVIPFYNEDIRLFEQTLQTITKAKGNKTVIVVDDGSQADILHGLKSLQDFYPFNLLELPQNWGKRDAINEAVKASKDEFTQKFDFIVCMDSDTVVQEDSFVRLMEAFSDESVGAVTGEVRLLNEKQNILTRMTAAYYWHAFNIFRQSHSSLGIVTCCSGALSAYRFSVFEEILAPMIEQHFLGVRCTYSEDRHLTNLVLQKGLKVIYRPEAICYTIAPSKFKDFLRQQQRWKRGYIRECTYTLSYSWKTNRILFFKTLFMDLGYIFYSFGARLLFWYFILTSPLLALQFIVPLWIASGLLRNILMAFDAKEKLPGLIVFMLYHEGILYWQNIYALFTMRNQRWLSREQGVSYAQSDAAMNKLAYEYSQVQE